MKSGIEHLRLEIDSVSTNKVSVDLDSSYAFSGQVGDKQYIVLFVTPHT
jgi:hypothetical protein